MKKKILFFILFNIFYLNVSFPFSCIKSKIWILFSSRYKIENYILNYINRSKKEVLLAAYQLTSKNIIYSLIKAYNRNVKIKILLDGKNITKKKYFLKKLYNLHIPIKLNFNYNIMHNKFLIIDNNSVETGSYNYTFSANHLNAENIIYLECFPKIALKYKREFLRLWNLSFFLKKNNFI